MESMTDFHHPYVAATMSSRGYSFSHFLSEVISIFFIIIITKTKKIFTNSADTILVYSTLGDKRKKIGFELVMLDYKMTDNMPKYLPSELARPTYFGALI